MTMDSGVVRLAMVDVGDVTFCMVDGVDNEQEVAQILSATLAKGKDTEEENAVCEQATHRARCETAQSGAIGGGTKQRTCA